MQLLLIEMRLSLGAILFYPEARARSSSLANVTRTIKTSYEALISVQANQQACLTTATSSR